MLKCCVVWLAPVTVAVRGEEKTGIEEEPQLKEKDSRKRTGTQEEVWRSSNTKQNYYLDATKEGNVGRFIKVRMYYKLKE